MSEERAVKGLVIEPDKAPEVREIKGYEGMRQAVGGYLELIAFTQNTVAYLNEEGKIQAKPDPPNNFATWLCNNVGTPLRPDDYIVGNMVLFGSLDDKGEYDGDEHDVPSYIVDMVQGMWRQYEKLTQTVVDR